ncbi:MAG: glycosyltransferase family 2 protein [Bacteroidales bacterium]|nr:glycosyltransferase family 2 protein [Bacteroidales bacterium]
MFLSVIIPVYNAGAYLEPCVRSVHQLPIGKEIILVDDGSTDGAVDRLPKELNCQIIRQPNQGVSVARNTGLASAKGEWIWFVDADDEVRTVSHNLPTEDCKAPMLLLPFVWDENNVQTTFKAGDGEIPYNLWRCWFRREEIEQQGLRFTPGRKYCEDQEFILKYLLQAGSATKAVEGPTYHYTMRASGAMRKPGMKRKQLNDIAAVWWKFSKLAFLSGKIGQKWVFQQQKRLMKTWWVIKNSQ